MKLTWLGQAGWLICTGAIRLMIDPYLSNALEEKNGAAYRRKVPIRPEYLSMQLDALVITHDHGDHLDWGTLRPLLAAQKKPMTILGPRSVWERLRQANPWHNELVLLEEGTQYTIGDVLLHGVFAAHSDPSAIGVVVENEGKRVYHCGDTLYHNGLIRPQTQNADVLLVPINGKGNNMNAVDAARLTRALAPKIVVPMHWDMFCRMGCDPNPFAELLAADAVQVGVLEAYGGIEL